MENSEAIKEIRKKLGFTQQQLANHLGLAVSSVARYEAGKKPEPRILVRFSLMAEESGWHDLATVFNNSLIGTMGLSARNSLLAFRRLRGTLEKLSKAYGMTENDELKSLLMASMSDLNFALNRLNEITPNPIGEDD